MTLEISTIKTIKLTDVYKAAGDMEQAVRNEVVMRHHGNQHFTNDTYFIYWLPSFNGDPMSPVQDLIAKLCKDAIVDHHIIFEVSW